MKKEKQPDYIYQEATALLKRAQEFSQQNEIGTKEGTFKPKLLYPHLPIAVLLATDIHYGSTKVNYEKLTEHLDIVKNTPNFFMVTNGDDVDNFNVTGKWATGTYENPLPPQLQTQALINKYEQLSEKGKLAAMSFGNHNDMMFCSGYDWFNSFAQKINKNTVIFPSGGFLHMLVGKEHYGMAMTHKYWGTSKKNPTNATKNFFDFEYPQADIAFLGHTHQSEMLHFEKGGKDRIGCIGGTYKLNDEYGRKQGYGGRAGQPGNCVLLYPDEHKMIGFRDVGMAQQFMLALITLYGNSKKKGETPQEIRQFMEEIFKEVKGAGRS